MSATCDSEESHKDSIRDLTVLNNYIIQSSCGSKTDQYSTVWLKIQSLLETGQGSFILNSAQAEDWIHKPANAHTWH